MPDKSLEATRTSEGVPEPEEAVREVFRGDLVALGTTILAERSGLSPQTLANIASGVRVHRRTWKLAREYLARREAAQRRQAVQQQQQVA